MGKEAKNKHNKGTGLATPRRKASEFKKLQTERKKVLNTVLESESRFRTIFENVNDGIILHDSRGNIFDVNQTMYKRLGYTKEEMLKMNLKELVTPEYGDKVYERVQKLRKNGVAIFESADRRKDGTVMPVEVSARYTEYGEKKIIQSVVRDISERKMAEDLLSSTLEEKDLLLEEIKQQIVFIRDTLSQNLLRLSEAAGDEKIKAVIASAQNRMKTMTYIQERIFRAPNFSRIDFSGFLKRLIPFVFALYQTGGKTIRIGQRVQGIHLDIRRSLRCAFLISELLANSLVHAFPDGREGEIHIEMEKTRNGIHKLSYRDNGIGFPPSFKDLRQAQTQGLRTVVDLVHQMNGHIRLINHNGAVWRVRF